MDVQFYVISASKIKTTNDINKSDERKSATYVSQHVSKHVFVILLWGIWMSPLIK